MTGKSALLTGLTGQDGAYLAEFLLHKGIDFAELARQKVNLVVVRSEMDYKNSLTSGDQFVVTVAFEAISKLRFGFRQQVIRQPDGAVMLQALVIGTALNAKGRPFVPVELGLLAAPR